MESQKLSKDQIRQIAEGDLEAFIRLVHPKRLLAHCHIELIRWWTRSDAKSHQLVLMPRDHMKSALVAYRVAWEITRNPAIRVLYISSTSMLAEKQLKFIQDILTSPIYRKYWPEMVHIDKGKRERWTTSEFSVDHPKRKEENVRDPTVWSAGLTTSITGMHCDISVMDDVVVIENAYTEQGRDKVEQQYSLLSSIEGTQGRQWVVGTRYHPKDLYEAMIKMRVELYDRNGDLISDEPLYEVYQKEVEDIGDGTGDFLWPVMTRADGMKFGFNAGILAKKKAQYLDKTQFRAQYYNDPNDPEDEGIPRDLFQYYDQKHLSRSMGKWYYKNKRLNVFAGIDFAFSLANRSDYTCICVVGVDVDYNYYVLDIDRFKTDQIKVYFDHILKLHQKWDFRKIRAEVTVGQKVIVRDLKDNYIRKHGLALQVEEHLPTRHKGAKEERIEGSLNARYHNGQMWHYYGGHCQTLEEELTMKHPPHDDVKDCLSIVIDTCIPPSAMLQSSSNILKQSREVFNRFGGV